MDLTLYLKGGIPSKRESPACVDPWPLYTPWSLLPSRLYSVESQSDHCSLGAAETSEDHSPTGLEWREAVLL